MNTQNLESLEKTVIALTIENNNLWEQVKKQKAELGTNKVLLNLIIRDIISSQSISFISGLLSKINSLSETSSAETGINPEFKEALNVAAEEWASDILEIMTDKVEKLSAS